MTISVIPYSAPRPKAKMRDAIIKKFKKAMEGSPAAKKKVEPNDSGSPLHTNLQLLASVEKIKSLNSSPVKSLGRSLGTAKASPSKKRQKHHGERFI